MAAGGKGGPLGKYNGGATGLILANDLTVANAKAAWIGFTTTQESVGTSDFPLEYRASILDQCVAGKEVFAGKQAATNTAAA